MIHWGLIEVKAWNEYFIFHCHGWRFLRQNRRHAGSLTTLKSLPSHGSQWLNKNCTCCIVKQENTVYKNKARETHKNDDQRYLKWKHDHQNNQFNSSISVNNQTQRFTETVNTLFFLLAGVQRCVSCDICLIKMAGYVLMTVLRNYLGNAQYSIYGSVWCK